MKSLRFLLFSLLIVVVPRLGFGGEGMWLPLLLKALNEAEMKSMGMRMSAEDIYSVNRGSLKDAIVRFGGGCTGSIISSRGLLLTNHHCGYGQIQSHSSLEHNYLEDGFWAKDLSEELPNPGLSVTFIVSMHDVTERVLQGVTEELEPRERQSRIDQNIAALKRDFPRQPHEDVQIRPFFQGNQYFLFVTVTYRDVRLVGAPPSSIGKFGYDTDNWVWPRHTGDFALFRVYADQNNLPAEYSPDNVPFTPKHFLPVSLDGVREGDFTLVFGFPGRTQEYLPSPAVQQVIEVIDPALIAVRDRSLNVLNAAMKADAEVKIQYASKQSGLANGWKKWQGEILGLQKTDALGKKRRFEKELMLRLQRNPDLRRRYGGLLDEFDQLYQKRGPLVKAAIYYSEIAGRNVDLFRLAAYARRLEKAFENHGLQGFESTRDNLLPTFKRIYKNYRPEIDRDVFAAVMPLYFEELPESFVAPAARLSLQAVGNDYQKWASWLFEQTLLAKPETFLKTLEMPAGDVLKALQNDPAYQLAAAMADTHGEMVQPPLNALNEQLRERQRLYMKAIMEAFPERKFYPDANGTLRLTYGKVEGYEPRDAVVYKHATYLEGVMEKYVPGDYEFDVPQKLRELYAAKDYGPYGTSGRMPVCFIGSNHTSGGNSGSPVIDAWGNLIGLNFDRVWEGTMSDIHYDPSLCRNIMVDIRYVLFLIDKFAGAKHLVEEMKIVHPRKKSLPSAKEQPRPKPKSIKE